MKSKRILTLAVALSLVAFLFVAVAEADVLQAYLTSDRHGRIYTWTVDTTQIDLFSGLDAIPNSIVFIAYVDDTPYYIIPNGIVLTEDYIQLIFVKQNLPIKGADSTRVEGSLIDGNTFFATGPGWGWGGHY